MKIKYLLITLMGLFIYSSCSEDKMDEIGTNPNSPTEVPIKLLISQATLTTAFETFGVDLAWYSSVFCEQTTGVHGQLETADKRTGINSTIGNNSWNGIYSGTLNDLKIIIAQGSEGGSEEGYWTAVGIAKTLTALNYSVLTDLWGDIPYTEALMGSENRTPVFDSQESVYGNLITLLDAAIVDLGKTSSGTPGSSDFFYEGESSQWIKASYAIKARLENHLSNIDSQGSATKTLAALSNAFTSADDNMVFSSYTTDATGENPWFQEENDRKHHAVSNTIFSLMDGLSDPRIPIFFGQIGGQYVPAPNGTAENDQGGTIYSRPSSTYLQADTPQPIVTYDELKFIEAEANLRLSNTTEAYDAYLIAIEEALNRENVAADDIATYLAQSNVAVGASNLTLETIIKQKYISLWLFNPIEAYNDYRRTRFPTLQNTVGPAPERFPYPNDEVSSNPNTPDISYTQKTWWAK
ncbi:SusD/RagB family nutrient-binding outer membrane lipoprotein [Mangrovibacterium lignilyticum]|uniref:SusD/RagB family nutrient-binding outer membrane lipoprotein n=1 Tax=Mangrovibacterium lignilyticum TaxID=2668052 RepID=UPI0013D4188E|nr:SusD/RagB family nutrient-binding outer membrane lipoprotein [Mangrovibacterium lignilyticum]